MPIEALECLRRQLDYDDWANRETFAALESGATVRGVELLGHVLATELLWLDRATHKLQRCAVWPDWSLEECGRRLDEVRSSWRDFLRFLEPAHLETEISYVNTKGDHYQSTVNDIVTHVLLHSAYHRGQIAASQRAEGAEPAYTDFIHAARQGILEAGGD
jgi:uncharacterized damage-inducible protein DinB